MRDIMVFITGALVGLGIAEARDPTARQRLLERLAGTPGPTEPVGQTPFDPFIREAARAVSLGAGELATLVAHVRAEIADASAGTTLASRGSHGPATVSIDDRQPLVPPQDAADGGHP